MAIERLKYLYQQYVDGNASEEELRAFKILLDQTDNDQEIFKLLDHDWDNLKFSSEKNITVDKADQIYQSIIQKKQRKRSIPIIYFRAAAAVLVCCLCGIWFFKNRNTNQPVKIVAKTKKLTPAEILPGSDKAVLTLGNGWKIDLNSVKSGQISDRSGMVINKIDGGHLVYVSTKKANQRFVPVASEENTITIPKGGQYHVTLPDGTQVYLNSQSTLTYPTQFLGAKRSVLLKGEAYFEVAKNLKMPFDVDVNGRQQIEVLGTHFNVEAYTDAELIKTTLLEGSVKITDQHQQILLKPGQTATQNANNLLVKEADLEEAMAWRNGIFVFNNENITSVMKKVSRWYNIDVVFKGKMDNINFIGNYSRAKSLTNLLKNIALMEKVHFVTEGRRVTVIAG